MMLVQETIETIGKVVREIPNLKTMMGQMNKAKGRRCHIDIWVTSHNKLREMEIHLIRKIFLIGGVL